MNTLEPLVARTLVRAAHHERPEDAPGVACVASVLAIANELQAGLRRRFEPLGLNEHKYAALLVLYTFDPVPTAVHDLAFHAQLSRSAAAEVLNQLAAKSWITRVRDPHDRRTVFVSLTKTGRSAAERALHEALRVFAELGRGIGPAAQEIVTAACGTLREHLPDVLAAPHSTSQASL